MTNLKLNKSLEAWSCEQCGSMFHAGQCIDYVFYCDDCSKVVMRAKDMEEFEEEVEAEGVESVVEEAKSEFSEVNFGDLQSIAPANAFEYEDELVE
jgi:NAD-dependent SIR2 family protein deacetylase